MYNTRIPPKKEVIDFKFLPEKNQIHVIIRECFEDVTHDLVSHRVVAKDGYGNNTNTTVYSHIRIYKQIYGVASNGKIHLLHIIPGEYIPARYDNANYQFEDNTRVDLY